MATTLDNDSGLIEFVDPGVKAEPVIHMSGRFEYSRKYDRAVRSFNTSMGTVVAGMWLGGENKTEQQDAVFIAEDTENNLWMAVADGLGGHPGGAEASQICCDILETSIRLGPLVVNDVLSDCIRKAMARDELIMSKPAKPGGACMAIICVDAANHRLHTWSMGDVEAGVQSWDTDVLLSNPLDSGSEFHQVSKVLSPRTSYEWSQSDTKLDRGERVFLHSDGFSNKAYRAFGDRNQPIDEQVRMAIRLSEREQGPNADNLSIICLDRFLPQQGPQGVYGARVST